MRPWACVLTIHRCSVCTLLACLATVTLVKKWLFFRQGACTPCHAIKRKKPIQEGRFLISRSALRETGESVPTDVIKSACLTAAGSSEIPHWGGTARYRG